METMQQEVKRTRIPLAMPNIPPMDFGQNPVVGMWRCL